LTISIAFSAQQSVPEQAQQEQAEIARVQDSPIDAYLHHDYTVLNRVLADDFSYIDDGGFVLTKQQILDAFNSSDDRISSYKRQDEKVRIFGDTAVVFFPGANAIRNRSSANSPDLENFDFIIKSGRAVMFPVYKGTFERGDGTTKVWPNTSSSYRDHVIAWGQEFVYAKTSLP
jgi:hypothetical protein